MAMIQHEITEGILKLTLQRAERRNALTMEMYDSLCEALRLAEEDPAVRVVFISGEGQTFCAGNDIASFMGNPQVGDDSSVVQFLRTLVRCNTPIVAAIHGAAIGIGTTMLLHCDLVYAAHGTKLALPFVNLGLVPEAGSSFLLPRIVGNAKAAELLLLGESFSAESAKEMGLINEVVSAETLQETAWAAAKALASKPPAALRYSKALIRGAFLPALDEALEAELQVFAKQLTSPEAHEAFTAFFEKRKPDFSKFS